MSVNVQTSKLYVYGANPFFIKIPAIFIIRNPIRFIIVCAQTFNAPMYYECIGYILFILY